EGLLPFPHNNTILDLLFDLAAWHAYAKLRLHTDDTLGFFDTATVVLGSTVRQFLNTTCETYFTKELPKETAARGRRTAALTSKKPAPPPKSAKQAGKEKAPPPPAPKRKLLNLQTYKYHALGDYPNTIRRFGTTDSYTTQTVGTTTLNLIPADLMVSVRVSCSTDGSSDAIREQPRTTRLLRESLVKKRVSV
ncbi:hypothetical protein BV22DRAFT_1020565, partial [Leucogyrophana mollusca]